MDKYGPRLKHARDLGKATTLPVTVISQLDSSSLQTLCALTTGEMPDVFKLACLPPLIARVRAKAGKPVLGALMELSWPQIDELCAQHDVLGVELAL
jgi:hypothetical protein